MLSFVTLAVVAVVAFLGVGLALARTVLAVRRPAEPDHVGWEGNPGELTALITDLTPGPPAEAPQRDAPPRLLYHQGDLSPEQADEVKTQFLAAVGRNLPPAVLDGAAVEVVPAVPVIDGGRVGAHHEDTVEFVPLTYLLPDEVLDPRLLAYLARYGNADRAALKDAGRAVLEYTRDPARFDRAVAQTVVLEAVGPA
jgi:hypothetical protein